MKKNKIVLPDWLDKYIFEILGARYDCQNKDLVVLEWDKTKVLGYLGTYFPRSYAESYCIFTNYFEKHKDEYVNRTELSIFDFGCGTGGELIGFIIAAAEQLPLVKRISVRALDGNIHALRFLEQIISQTSIETNIDIQLRVIPIVIDDFYDMGVTDSIITESYDFIITFKAICEFVTMQQFEQKNPYKHILEIYLPHLTSDGILCIADVTTYSDVSNEWLPKMLDQASLGCGAELIARNEGYNEEFYVSHSNKRIDRSKIAWRIYKNNKKI